jgi:hypothetical protein
MVAGPLAPDLGRIERQRNDHAAAASLHPNLCVEALGLLGGHRRRIPPACHYAVRLLASSVASTIILDL